MSRCTAIDFVRAAAFKRRGRVGVAIFLAAAATAVYSSGQSVSPQPRRGTARQKQEITKRMSDSFTSSWDPAPIDIGVPGIAIAPATRYISPPPAPPGTDGAARRFFINDSLNGRVIHAAGAAEPAWRERWRADLQPGLTPVCLMSAGERILLQALGEWSLWNTEGKLIGTGAVTASSMVLDPSGGLFFGADHAGLIVARRLEDGQPAFSMGLTFGRNFSRTFIARRGQRLFVISLEMAQDPHSPEPENSMIETVDLGDPGAQKSFGQPGAPVVSADLMRATRLLVPAMHGDSVIVATQNRIYRMDLELRFQSALTGSFTPRFLSVDETGVIYLLADFKEGTAFAEISDRGGRLNWFVLPSGAIPSMPPVIGYDHTAYILAGSQIYSIGVAGKLNWTRAAGGTIAGAVATTDGRLVIAAGSLVSAYDAKGARQVLHTFKDHSISAGPIFTQSGDILVASGTSLFCLTRR